MTDSSDERVAVIVAPDGSRRELRPGGVLRIGRHDDNDIVLKDSTVSRFHTTLRWDPELERPIVYDNGSQNGTLVDGKELRSSASPTSHGGQIEISHFKLQVELKNCGETPAILADASEMVTLFSEQGPEIRGHLGGEGALRELLQRLEAERRSGTLHLELPQQQGGTVTVCLGKIMTAECSGGQTGYAALGLLLSRGVAGRYRFTRELEPCEESLDLWFSDYQRNARKAGTVTRSWKRSALLSGLDEDEPRPR